MTNANPWLAAPGHPTGPPTTALSQTRRMSHVGATAPQRGVPAPNTADRLPQLETILPAAVWWLGVHGGAGESTLANLTEGTRAAGHAWPVPVTPGVSSRVVLVARTNFGGLMAVQRAATEWASGTLGNSVQLAGLVLIADAPGRRPKPLRDLEHVIAGGVPRLWSLPFVDAWRLGPATAGTPVAKEFHELFADLSLTLSPASASN